MNDLQLWPYLSFIELMPLALIGMVYHWYEKKHLHLTTTASLMDYLLLERAATYRALKWMAASITLIVLAHQGTWVLQVSEVAAALAAGYGFDNALNKAPDEPA
jgi:hypothetical protein